MHPWITLALTAQLGLWQPNFMPPGTNIGNVTNFGIESTICKYFVIGGTSELESFFMKGYGVNNFPFIALYKIYGGIQINQLKLVIEHECSHAVAGHLQQYVVFKHGAYSSMQTAMDTKIYLELKLTKVIWE